MQPFEIQREVEALRDIRRRSTSQGGPGALLLDPDLPTQPATSASPLSPDSPYWPGTVGVAVGGASSSSSGHGTTLSASTITSVTSIDQDADGDDDGSADGSHDSSHLFWVPAHVHPELAPGAFKSFIKEHARVQADGSLRRANSSASTSSGLSGGLGGVGRRSSLLRRQYKPAPNDHVEDESDTVLPLRRNRSALYSAGPQLTIDDLQKLEQLAEEASLSDDPTKLRSVLRRSMSLNIAPSSLDQIDMPEMAEDADAPIIIPPPNQILRRAARTKIRKGTVDANGGSRFGPARRGSARASMRRGSDVSSSLDHSDPDVPSIPPLPRHANTIGVTLEDPRVEDSFSDESLIYAAYGDEERQVLSNSPPPIDGDESALSTSPPASSSPRIEIRQPSQEEYTTTTPPRPPRPESAPMLHAPQPQHALNAPSTSPPSTSRSPSPEYPTSYDGHTPISGAAPPRTRTVSEPGHFTPPAPPIPAISPPRKEKEKKGQKGLFGFGKKGGKDKEKDKEKERIREQERERERAAAAAAAAGDVISRFDHSPSPPTIKEKEKESGFFGSLFGGGKKTPASSPASSGSPSPRESAERLLGAARPKGIPMPGGAPDPQFAGSWARYPIHVERAVYRLSHIKLANPRRPLYEQVLISNLMFWYLGVINKQTTTQQPGQQQGQMQQQEQQQGGPAQGQEQNGSEDEHMQGSQDGQEDPAEKARLEREQREREDQERAMHENAERETRERERQERERQEAFERQREQIEREQQQQRAQTELKAQGPRRGLTKTPPQGTRSAEMPIRGPQYDMQHRAISQEYGGPPPGAGPGRISDRRGGQAPSPIPIGSHSSAYANQGQQYSPGHPISPPPQRPPASPSMTPLPLSPNLSNPQPLMGDSFLYGGSSPHERSPSTSPPLQQGRQPQPMASGLPPGAMQPMGQHQMWQPPPQGRPPMPPSSQSRQGAPPPIGAGYPQQMQQQQPYPRTAPVNGAFPLQEHRQPSVSQGNKLPSRSLSATASPVRPANGKLRKTGSAQAVPPNAAHLRRSKSREGGDGFYGYGNGNAGAGEEDTPLAVWQQQQQRRR